MEDQQAMTVGNLGIIVKISLKPENWVPESLSS